MRMLLFTIAIAVVLAMPEFTPPYHLHIERKIYFAGGFKYYTEDWCATTDSPLHANDNHVDYNTHYVYRP